MPLSSLALPANDTDPGVCGSAEGEKFTLPFSVRFIVGDEGVQAMGAAVREAVGEGEGEGVGAGLEKEGVGDGEGAGDGVELGSGAGLEAGLHLNPNLRSTTVALNGGLVGPPAP